MKTIYKYPLSIGTKNVIEMPIGAKILDLQTQNGTPGIWAMVDSGNQKVQRIFEIYGTGHMIDGPTDKDYVGTFQVSNGAFVFHVFELVS